MEHSVSTRSFAIISLVFICSVASALVSSSTTSEIYRFIWVLPLAYAPCFAVWLYHVNVRQFSIFTVTLLIMSFIRYVMLPVGMVLANRYTGKSMADPSQTSVNVAIFLMVYELVALSAFLSFHSRRRKFNTAPAGRRIRGERQFEGITSGAGYLIFGAFFALTVGLVAMYPHTIVNFNFITPTSRTVKNMVEIGTMEQIATLCLSVTKQFIALFISYWCYSRYRTSGSSAWSIISLLAMLLNACIYTGTNRSDFILMAVASFLLHTTLFPKRRRATAIIMATLLLLAVPALSAYRKAGVLDVSNGFQGFIDSFTNIMWGYTGGPYNVAIAYEAADMYPEGRNLFNLIYDFLRPTIGLNLIMQQLPLTYSNVYFNYRYYMAEKVTQIMPMVGESYFYFGVIGAPLITLLFGWLGLKLSQVRRNTNDPFVVYFLTITCCRLGFIMGQNATIQMNDLSFNLFIPLLLIFMSRKLKSAR